MKLEDAHRFRSISQLVDRVICNVLRPLQETFSSLLAMKYGNSACNEGNEHGVSILNINTYIHIYFKEVILNGTVYKNNIKVCQWEKSYTKESRIQLPVQAARTKNP